MKSGEYKIEESQKGLTIILLFPEHIRTYKELFFLTLSFSLFFFVFVGLDLIMQGLLWLIFLFFMFMGPSILGYLYYKNQ